MTVDYLRGNATASATGLFVICRHLAEFPNGRKDDELRRALQVLRGGSGSSNEPAAVLTATLAIGDGLGVLSKDSSSSTWTVEKSMAELAKASGDSWAAFRGELLHRVASRGVAPASGDSRTPDLVLGLTWFMQLNPLSPVAADWSKGPGPLVEELGFEAVSRSEQWRPFVRWAIALGLARRSDSSTPKVVIPDASTAIYDQLPALPKSATVREWLSSLQERLPILGAPSLTDQLPQGRVWDEVPAAVVLGLLKLEKMGALVLQPSDDASDVMSIGFGVTTRQIGRINIGSERD
jgi:hypothetical protein